jgi:hypothetical protein
MNQNEISGIVFSSRDGDIRDSLKSSLRTLSRLKSLKILDCGGGLNPWLGDLVTHVIDFASGQTSAKVILGDLCDINTWSRFKDKEFDFVNCTHTLEDIRDPNFVKAQMTRVAKAGFVAVPNHEREFSFIQSNSYLGYGHHRWIFKLLESKLVALPKFPAISSPRMAVRTKFVKNPTLTRLVNQLPSLLLAKLSSNPDYKKSMTVHELGFIWLGDFDFTYFNGDYAGDSVEELIEKTIGFISLREEMIQMNKSEDLVKYLSKALDIYE